MSQPNPQSGPFCLSQLTPAISFGYRILYVLSWTVVWPCVAKWLQSRLMVISCFEILLWNGQQKYKGEVPNFYTEEPDQNMHSTKGDIETDSENHTVMFIPGEQMQMNSSSIIDSNTEVTVCVCIMSYCWLRLSLVFIQSISACLRGLKRH